MSDRRLPPGLDELPSGKIRARYRDADGRQHSRSFDGVREAQKWRTAQMAAVTNGSHVDPSYRTTVAKWAEEWCTNRPVRSGTTTKYRAMLGHVEDTPLGQMRVSKVQPHNVQAWVTSKSVVLSPATLARYYGFVRTVFASAVDNDLIHRSPCRGVKLPKIAPKRYAPLTIEDVRRLGSVIPARYYALVLLQGTLGLRIGEALGLMSRDIDRENRTLRIERQLLQDGTLGPVKNPELGERTIPLPPHVLRVLLAHMLRFPTRKKGDELDGLIFTTSFGNALIYNTYRSKVFVPALKRAHLPEDAGTHALRHAAISDWLMRKVPITTAARMAGHTVTEMLETYSHALPQGDDDFLRATASAWTDERKEALSVVR